jgi:hypothetical protein
MGTSLFGQNSEGVMGMPSSPEQPFVWSLLNHQGHEHLKGIIKRKEAERRTGGTAWIAIGTLLGDNLIKPAEKYGGRLQVVFCAALRESPAVKCPHHLWSRWVDRLGDEHDIPEHVLVVGPRDSENEYALVCTSDTQFSLQAQPFSLGGHQTYPRGKQVGFSQRAAMLTRRSPEKVGRGTLYRQGFTATLVEPWQVKLLPDRQLTDEELAGLIQWQEQGTYEKWQPLVGSIRGRMLTR